MNPGKPLTTPVVVILFNRPRQIRELVEVLRRVQPTRILAVADGPRAGHPGDIDACRQARAAVEGIDWPCWIECAFSDTNLGCDRRIVSGLDWAFSRVDRAIVLEDDIRPDPSFLPWAESMLDQFGSDPSISIISGWNPLGTWGAQDASHIRAPHGSIWGWAATAASWRRIQGFDLRGDPAAAPLEAGRHQPEALLHEHWTRVLVQFRRGELSAWDTVFNLRAGMLGLDAIHSPVNLVRNTGIGPGATRTVHADDFTALIPSHTARPVHEPFTSQPRAAHFSRAALMVQLVARCRNAAMAARLARLVQRGSSMPIDDATRHHLAPFLHAGETLALLKHLATQGVSSPAFDSLLQVLHELAAHPDPAP